MRITNQLMTQTGIDDMQQALQRLYDLQQKATTGKRYSRASENPAVTTQGMNMRSTLTQLETYQRTMASTDTWLESTDLALQQLSGVLEDGQEIVLKGMSGTLGEDERKVIATELDGIINQMLDIVNSKDRDRYIFSGLKTEVKPFELVTDKVEITDLWVNVRANINTTNPANIVMTVNDQTINNPTETAPGSGIYEVSPTSTPASPLPGITIRVDTNTDPDTYYVNGTLVPLEGSDANYPGITTNVNIPIPAGDPNYPAYTRDTVVYNGDQNTIQRYIGPNELLNVNINGGAFGLTPYLDNSVVPAVTLQTSDMFNIMIKLRDVMAGEDYISPHDLTSGATPYVATSEDPDKSLLQAAYGQLQKAFNNASEQMTYNGSRMRNLDNSIKRADTAKLEIESLLSQYEEVNMAEAISEVNNQTMVYQAVLNMSGRTQSMLTLFDTLQ